MSEQEIFVNANTDPVMDWVIDMKNEKLIANPKHGGEWVLEEY